MSDLREASVQAALRSALEQSSWEAAGPSERSLVALFAAMTRRELEQFLRELMVRAIGQLELNSSWDFTPVRGVVSGTTPQIIVAAEWAFPGAEELMDAVEELDACLEVWRVPIKSLSRAHEAAESTVSSVVAHRVQQRAAGISTDGQRERHEVWSLLLSGLSA